MILSRQRPKAALVASFGLGILMLVLAPKLIGYQDLSALVARHQVVTERSANQVGALFGERKFSRHTPNAIRPE